MRRLSVIAGAMLLAAPSYAAQISAGSELSINGPDTFDSSTNLITFTGPGNVQGTGGDFDVLAPCTGCVAMTPTLGANTSGLLYNVGDAGQNSSLVLHPPQSAVLGGTDALPTVTVNGTGTLTLSGFDATPGSWELTTQGPDMASVTFSATAIPQPTTPPGPPSVPEPGSLSILALAVVALGFVRGLTRSLD